MNIKITSDEFLDYVIDILSPLYQVKTRKLFGGYGLYINGKIFALIAKQELYFKASNQAMEFLIKFDSEPFSYKKRDKIIKMSYWKVPAEILENPELLQQCLSISLQ
ncbi:TfoX/Sxy family protein [Candidatus Tisiphia endosymbiont of Nemotelus uliginosus]|uniref:TfoX/Sxy family protein n=1 Tax=Candidatus Tisiphia endosymbiont of Nemotelus uliginosus TaxID=3077926 RepID=UPI0035C91555